MKFLVFSDIHGDRRALEKLLATEADYYFAAGDLATWGRGLDSMGQLLKKRAGQMYVIPGNHESDREVARLCEDFGLHNFHGQLMTVAGGWNVAGLGYSSPTPFNTPGEYTEGEMERHLGAFDGLDHLVMVCHCPPRGTALDEMDGGGHAGSTAVKDFIDRVQPAVFFCGHIHEAAGRSIRIGRTLAVNVGKAGYLLDFDRLEL
jgi:uncharacterized protein